MIVSISLGDEGVNVCLDDGIDSYDPIRTVEMCRVARQTFVGAYMDTLTLVLVDVEDDDAVVDEPPAALE